MSSKIIVGVNDLATLRPDLIEDWDWENNYKSPEELSIGSSYRASWVCHVCNHEWECRLDSRTKNMHGCPMCAKGGGSSVPDYTLYKLLEMSLDCEVLYRFNVLPNREADIYIPSKKIVIEYDGYGFHKSEDKKQRDITKEKDFISAGMKVFRFIERKDRLKEINIFETTASIPEMCMDSFNYLKEVLIECCCKWGIIEYCSIPDGYFELELSDIRKKVSKPTYERSVAYLLDNSKDLEWVDEYNGSLKPDEIYKSIKNQRIFIKCSKGHIFECIPRHINDGYGCRVCSGKYNKVLDKIDLAYNTSLVFKGFSDSTASIEKLKFKKMSCNCPFCGIEHEYSMKYLFDNAYSNEFCPCTKDLLGNVTILGKDLDSRVFYYISVLGRYFLAIADNCKNDIILRRLRISLDSVGVLDDSLFRKYLSDPYVMLTRYNLESTVPVNSKKIGLKLIVSSEENIINCYEKLKNQKTTGIEITYRNENIYLLDKTYIVNTIKGLLEKRFGMVFTLNRTVDGIGTSLSCNSLGMYFVVRVNSLKPSSIEKYKFWYNCNNRVKKMFFLSNNKDLVDESKGFFYIKENVFESELDDSINSLYVKFLNYYGYSE